MVKSNIDAVYEGKGIEGPLSRSVIQSGSTYLIVVNNTIGDRDSVLDDRVPIHRDKIPLVYLKHRLLGTDEETGGIRAESNSSLRMEESSKT